MTDPIAVAATYLNDALGVRVRADRVGHQVGSPLVLVALSDLDRVVKHRLERADYTAHCFSASKAEAIALAMRARNALLDVPIHAVDGVVITDSYVGGPSDLPDEDTREQRFILNFTLFYYESGEH